jgi:predicted kinase
VGGARLLLTCGLPGSGKTTLARQLAVDRSAVRLTKDEWLWALGASPWDAPTNDKVERELWRIAQDILSLGVSVVLDFGLWARVERDEMRTVARRLGVGVELHYVNADRRTLAANRDPELGATLGQRADPPRPPCRMGLDFSGARRGRTGLV